MKPAQALNQLFLANADPNEAEPMAAYMKGRFTFYGIKSPLRKTLFRNITAEYSENLKEREDIIDFVKGCWEFPYREMHYCAVEFLSRKNKILVPQDKLLIEYLVTTHSWWDTVDGIASNIIGPWLAQYPSLIPATTDEWIVSNNLWLQRCCLLFQLKYKQDTDIRLLEHVIERLRNHNDFFIRKAIGWILRQYAKTNPEYVRDFVKRTKLSPLSEREALKHL